MGLDVRGHVFAAFAPSWLLSGLACVLLGTTPIEPGRIAVIGASISVAVPTLSSPGAQPFGATRDVESFFDGGILFAAVGLSSFAARPRRAA